MYNPHNLKNHIYLNVKNVNHLNVLNSMFNLTIQAVKIFQAGNFLSMTRVSVT